MNDGKPVALVTGANRGIGKETCRQLAQSGYRVVLTARDPEKGEAACDELRRDALDVVFHQLDVTDADSVTAMAQWLQKETGYIDTLVNNAAVLRDQPDNKAVSTDLETVRETLETNVYGVLRVTQALIPLLRPNARIVNVSSNMGQLSEMNGNWPGYRLSKAALNALTRMWSQELADKNIKVNSVHPGWVKTEMGGPNATRSVKQGAKGIVWAATLPEDGPSGGFFYDGRRSPW